MSGVLRVITLAVLVTAAARPAAAQTPTPVPAALPPAESAASAEAPPPDDQGQTATTRQALIEQAQAEKAKQLHPYAPNKAERIFGRLDTVVIGGTLKWHPYFQNAYSGGGFALGAGRATFVSPYNYVDFRGSYSIKSYKRVEAEFVAPRLFTRHARLSVLGGWREATQVGFYGLGNDTTKENRTNYLFNQPYLSALIDYFPTRRVLYLRGGLEFTKWHQDGGEGSFPSVDEIYSPATLPGLGADVKYTRLTYGLGLDWRTSPGYTRRGGSIAATVHEYRDRDDEFGFRFVEYEATQFIPILREAWVLAFRARVQTSSEYDGEQTPFFMLPSVGGGSSLRGYSSWRFRDQNSLLLQGEWRIAVNRYLDLAFFYDTGKVAASTGDIDLHGLKSDWGVGTRFHGPFSTPLRIEVAKSRETLSLIFSSTASF